VTIHNTFVDPATTTMTLAPQPQAAGAVAAQPAFTG
jgi:hypothetical protein